MCDKKMGNSTRISTRRLAAEVAVLEPADFPRRVIYFEWLLEQCYERPNFLNCILFTDEAGFTHNSVFNSHNTHIWSDENPQAYYDFNDGFP